MELDELITQEELDRAHEFLLNKENIRTIDYVNKLLDKDQSNEQAWLILGIAKRRIGKLDEAIGCFETSLEFDSSLIEAWGLITVTFLDKGNVKKAKETMEKAIEINPGDEKIRFYRDNLIRVYEKFGPFF